MLTLALQILVALLTLAVGVAALAVAGARGVSGARAAGWRATGLGFAIVGATGVVQTNAAAVAYFAGPGSAVYDAYLSWAPAGNHGRSGAVLVLALLLCLLSYGRGGSWLPSAAGMLVLYGGGTALGVALGVVQGELRQDRHYPVEAMLQLGAMLLFLLALLAGAVTSSMDRLLWLLLAVYALHQAISVLWMTALAWDGVGEWIPRTWILMAVGAALRLVQLGLALHRLRLARRGASVPGLFEPLDGSAATLTYR